MNLAFACCGRWAADRARFALYATDAAGADSAWTFRDIQCEANRFSNVLAAVGIMRGDRVALLLPQRAETAALHIACYQMGAVAVPLSLRLDAADLASSLAAADARIVIVGRAGQVALENMRGRPRHAIGIGAARAAWLRDWAALRPLASTRYTPQEALAGCPALLLDGGTPLQRELAHGGLDPHIEAFRAAHPGYPQAGDLFWAPAEWATSAGLLQGLLPAWSCGQPVVAYDGDFDAEAACALITKYDVRNVRLAADQLEAMMNAVPRPNEKYDCHLRTAATQGALAAPVEAWVATELGILGALGHA